MRRTIPITAIIMAKIFFLSSFPGTNKPPFLVIYFFDYIVFGYSIFSYLILTFYFTKSSTLLIPQNNFDPHVKNSPHLPNPVKAPRGRILFGTLAHHGIPGAIPANRKRNPRGKPSYPSGMRGMIRG
jgi:hypothetical protein